MTPEKCREVVQFYRENLVRFFAESKGIKVKKCKIEPQKLVGEDHIIIPALVGGEEKEAVAHLLYMLGEMERFLDEDRMEKFFRWLGFVQGVCWTLSYQTLEELKNLNRPPGLPEERNLVVVESDDESKLLEELEDYSE